MKIDDTRPTSRAGQVSGGTTRRTGKAAEAGTPRRIADTASVAGIPESELTPKVREAIMALMAEVDDLRRRLDHATSRLSELERLADEDSLVPLPNRRAFVRELSRITSFSQRYGVPASLIFFDLNGLKAINDSLGHAAGDAALRQVAEMLVSNVRESDVVGRLGGDEFGVILVQADEKRAAEKAETLAALVRGRPLAWEGKMIQLGLAYGVRLLGEGDPGAALAEADRAMYVHKQSLKDGG